MRFFGWLCVLLAHGYREWAEQRRRRRRRRRVCGRVVLAIFSEIAIIFAYQLYHYYLDFEQMEYERCGEKDLLLVRTGALFTRCQASSSLRGLMSREHIISGNLSVRSRISSWLRVGCVRVFVAAASRSSVWSTTLVFVKLNVSCWLLNSILLKAFHHIEVLLMLWIHQKKIAFYSTTTNQLVETFRWTLVSSNDENISLLHFAQPIQVYRETYASIGTR